MRPIIIVMLAVDIALFLVTAYAVAVRIPTADRPRPIWSSFTLSLVITGNVSVQIANDHPGKAGADLLGFAGPLLIGMGIMAALMLVRERLDARAAQPPRPAA